jgi:hypothetical protein
MVTMGILPYQEKNPHGTAWNRTQDLIISSQKRWPLDHKAGHMDMVQFAKQHASPFTCGNFSNTSSWGVV